MDFNNLLGTLARSSAQAVSTLSKSSEEIEKFKEYLYVESDIEEALREILQSKADQADSIVFLCGSSGDGKSELLRRYYVQFKDKFTFHLDATHSFEPDQNAIEALDELFDRYAESKKPLVVGINVGMLLNFQNMGAERHAQIKEAVSRFIDGDREFGRFRFLNFEDYPKFSLIEGEVGSKFISQLLEKVADPNPSNSLYQAYLADEANHAALHFHNYRLLQESSVRELIVQNLLQARLRYDQFFSTRAILDFINHLIAGGSVLFDNMFASPNNGIAGTLCNLDPCRQRSQQVDEFVVLRSLGVEIPEFDIFKAAYEKRFGAQEMSPSSWVRAFYMLQDVDLGNNYHQRYRGDFKQTLYDRYVRVWQLHNLSGDKSQLRDFYNKYLIASLTKFTNRLVPKVVDDGMFLAERNGVVISAKVRVSMDAKALANTNNGQIHCFNAALKVGDTSISPFPVTISFLELVQRIMAGYRPNRHDKNTVVILEELVDEITRIASQTKSLRFHKGLRQWSLILDDDEFIVEADR